ncbi:hypothetical protein ENBRE01_1049 [Enteropsectra breve]|nr:hypothetical protein ENBRE01_1049 [Enteropsectra breve]
MKKAGRRTRKSSTDTEMSSSNTVFNDSVSSSIMKADSNEKIGTYDQMSFIRLAKIDTQKYIKFKAMHKSLALKAGKITVTYFNKATKISIPRIKLSKYHAILHKILSEQSVPRPFVLDFVDNPAGILRLEGSRRVNMLIFLAFIGELRKGQINDLEALAGLEPDQKLLIMLISGDEALWKELLKMDIRAFIRLRKFLRLQIENKLGLSSRLKEVILLGDKILGEKENKEIKGSSDINILSFGEKIKHVLKLHKEYCLFSKKNSISRKNRCFMEQKHEVFRDQMAAYKKLIKNIKMKVESNRIYESIPFYNEIDLYNEYVISVREKCFIDNELLESAWETPNEKTVHEYVRKKLGK